MRKLPKDSGFKIPEKYFDSIKESILEQIHLEEELLYMEDEGFRVPTTYFENNQEKLIGITKELQSSPTTRVINFSTFKRVSIVAAAVILLFIILKPLTQPESSISSLDAVAIESYIEDTNLENIEFDVEWLVTTDSDDLLLDSVNTSENNILDYLQQQTDIMDLKFD